jgi:hypothetical protein
MNQTVYIVASRHGIGRMTKNLPELRRGEIPIKVNIKIDEKAFRVPTIEREIVINDWQEGVDIGDVEFRKDIITQDEADMIRQRRFDKMKELLEEQGYTIAPPLAEELAE